MRLYKKEKLTGDIAIGSLFGPASDAADVHTLLAYPLRAVWRVNERRHSDAPVRFLVSVPKRRVRHAVDRVLLRRRVREAFRQRRPYPDPVSNLSAAQTPVAVPNDRRIDMVLMYVANDIQPYNRIDRAMCRIFKHLVEHHLGGIASPDMP